MSPSPLTTRRIFALLLLLLLACGPIPETDGLLGNLGDRDPAPAATPTPPGDTISYKTFTYRISLPEGETVPGTTIRYIGQTTDAYEVEIDGLTAFKQTGDSLPWKGIIAPGVVGHYDMRLAATFLGELFAAGPVEITVLDPLPIELSNSQQFTAPLYFEEIVVRYVVPTGHTLPGTTLTYQGQSELGAELGGTENYPYLSPADSLRWTGQLRDNVVVRYSLRVVSFNAENLQVAGTAELWIR